MTEKTNSSSNGEGRGKKPQTFRLVPDTVLKLIAFAGSYGMSKTAYIELALKERFKKDRIQVDTRVLAQQHQDLLDAACGVYEIVESRELDPQAKLNAIKRCIESALENDRQRAVDESHLGHPDVHYDD
jgi:hypothetical protein